VGKIAVQAVGAVDHTDSERQEEAAVESERLGGHRAVHIPQQPEADKECKVASQEAAAVVAVAGTEPVVHVAADAVVVVVAAAAAAAAIESFASHHSHNWHTEQTAQAEGAVVKAPVLGRVQMAIEDCTSAAVEAELPLRPWLPPNTPNNLVG
jgi:hypothetical protein